MSAAYEGEPFSERAYSEEADFARGLLGALDGVIEEITRIKIRIGTAIDVSARA